MDEQENALVSDKPTKDDFLVVGIGASAGGVEALQQFFAQVPANSNIVYVVILHLSPDYDSQLAEILQRETSLPVTQVTEKVSIQPDHVYVVPPNQHLLMMEDAIAVSPNLHVEERRAPVDIFFRSLADKYNSRAVGIILSGTGANGSMGLKRIKELGGAVFVQNPRETQYNEMPRNAIATDLVDGILPVADIPAKLVAYKESLGTVHITIENTDRPDDQQHALREIFTQLRVRTGHDFTNYKRPTLLRRIERRINVHNLQSLTAYATYLQQNPDEAHALLKDLLISVTNFFRDRKAFDAIEADILPRMLHDKGAVTSLRIWVIGCATGEEAYSLAMLCAERTLNKPDAPRVQIFATDIDEDAIAVARSGVYSLNDAADVSPERLRRYFTKEGDSYRVRREIREMVLFANHNALKDPPFSHLDMISCRNVMIYLNSTAQERVLETMHFALEPGGYLFLGSAESVDGAGDLFTPVNREQHIYQSRAVVSRFFPVPEVLPSVNHTTNKAEHKLSQEAENRAITRISYADLHQQLLEQYAPPSVVVNEEYDIVHLTERAGKYLQIGGGEISKNLLKLINPELRLELRTALYQAIQRRTNVEARNLKIKLNDTIETLNIHVRPVLREEDTIRGFMLVLFEPSNGEPENEQRIYTSNEPIARQLEEELIQLKAQLRSNLEQQELQAEELKASNEELQAMNEELRSAVEELETGKEELQSINEELTTVNQELKVKVEETSLSNSNFQNLINSTDIATLFLDRSLRINLFTPAAIEIFNLIPADYGRPISDITNKLEFKGLQDDAETVLEKLKTIEREVWDTDGKIYLMRVLPYRTDEDRISGVVLTFVNITERKKAEEAARAADERMRLIVANARDYAIFTLDVDRCVNSWNIGAQNIFGYTEEEIIGKSGDFLFVPEDRDKDVPAMEAETAHKEGHAGNERWHLRKDGSRFWGSGITNPLYDTENKLLGYVKIMRDLTERQQAEEALRASENRFRTVTDAVPQVIWTNDANGKANYFNQRWYEYSGLNYEQSVGLGWQTIVHPDDEPTSVESWHKALMAGEVFNVEFRLRRADGIYRWHLGRNVPLKGENGEIAGWFGSATDIEDLTLAQTSLRESEERTRALISQTSVGILSTDADGQLVFMNDKARSMFGFKAENGTAHITIWDLTSAEDIEEHQRLFKRLITEGLPFQFERKLKRQNGSQFWASVSMAPIKNEKGKAQSAVSVIVDITGRKQAEEALRETMERFQYAVRATKDVISEIDLTKERVWWSSMMHTLFGYAQGEVQHSIAWYQSLIHPDDRKRVVETFTRAIEGTEELWMDEFRFRHANGTYMYVTSRSFILRDVAGKALRMIGAMQDITERKLAEEAVRKSEERLRVTMESATDYVIITTDTKGNIENWNSGAERIFGYQASEVTGKYTDFFYTPEDRAADVPAEEMKTARTEGCAMDERWHQRKNGTRIFMSGVLAPIRNNGVLTGYVKVARDMTAQKEAENALRISEERFRVSLEAGELASWDWNLITNKIIWNEKHYQLFGLETNDEEREPEDFLERIYPDDLAYVKTELMNAVGKTSVYKAEFRIIRKDNAEIRWMSGYGRVTERNDGNPSRMVGVMYDITERKLAEEELQTAQNSLNTALEAAQMGVWDLDVATGAVMRSPRHDQLLGYSTYQEEWRFDMATKNMAEEDRQKFVAASEKLFVTGFFDVEAQIHHSNGSLCWVHIYGRLFKNEQGEATHAAGVIFDITDRKTIEQKKDEFIGIASHELKTPVTSIKAYTDILYEQMQEGGDEQSAVYIQKLSGQVDRLTRLIRDLLDATRISEGRLSLQNAAFDINKMLRETVDDLQQTSINHQILLDLQEVPFITGDKEKLQQVFINLLSNAVKYSPESDKVLVKSYRENKNIVIEIQDFGIGMSPETQSKLFERFFRSYDPNITTFPGLGLGLYISQEIVKQHKGVIKVQSEKGKGSVFTVVLPMEQ